MQVRLTFKHKYCRTLQLPSGGWSDYDMFPITEQEVRELTKDIKSRPKGEWITMDEYLLWCALRLKYGINYLKPKKQKFLSHIDRLYEMPKEESLEEKLLFYCDSKLEEICTLACEKWCSPEPQRDTANEKNFRSSLDNPDLDVLY